MSRPVFRINPLHCCGKKTSHNPEREISPLNPGGRDFLTSINREDSKSRGDWERFIGQIISLNAGKSAIECTHLKRCGARSAYENSHVKVISYFSVIFIGKV